MVYHLRPKKHRLSLSNLIPLMMMESHQRLSLHQGVSLLLDNRYSYQLVAPKTTLSKARYCDEDMRNIANLTEAPPSCLSLSHTSPNYHPKEPIHPTGHQSPSIVPPTVNNRLGGKLHRILKTNSITLFKQSSTKYRK